MNVSTSISTSLTSNLYGDYLVGGQPNEQRTIDIVLVDIYDNRVYVMEDQKTSLELHHRIVS